MHKAELDLKRDQLIPSSSAVARLQELHQLMNSSLMYTKRLVSFMVFEQEGGEVDGVSSLDDDASMTNLNKNADGEDSSTSVNGGSTIRKQPLLSP